MTLLASTSTAFRALRANLARSLLTVLGIIIGILAIVLMVTLSRGAERLILQEIEGIGANTIIVRPGRQPEGPTDLAETILSDSLTERDLIALRNPANVSGLQSLEPAIFVTGVTSYQDQLFRASTIGWTPTGLQEVFNVTVSEGRMFNPEEISQRAKVAVLGSRVREELFGESDALGEFITIGNHKLQVVGLLPPGGQVSFFNIDEWVFVPYTTAQRTLRGINHYDELFVKAKPGEDVNVVAHDIRLTLRETHNITNPDKDDFFVNTQQNALETLSNITNILAISLIAISSIALVVAGVGIMNIMLVSVTERTAEIGLRKAVGATNRDILTQFLIEALLLTGSGGVLGTLLALVLAWLIAFIIRTQFNLNWPSAIPFGALLIGIGVSTVVGLIFGLFPARQAARKDPIRALRYE
jgi:putative ABC transport system permease protein